MISEIYQDSLFLYDNKKIKSSLLLLLCLIDALAKKHHPNILLQKDRYCVYLKEKLIEQNLDESFRIEEKGTLLHFSEIIYTYFRCFFVHEANDRSENNYEVQIEYESPGGFRFNGLTLMDRQNKKFIVKGDKLIEILQKIIYSDFLLNS